MSVAVFTWIISSIEFPTMPGEIHAILLILTDEETSLVIYLGRSFETCRASIRFSHSPQDTHLGIIP